MTSIDPEKRQVTTDTASYDADILVVALGADYDFAATPGFEEGGVEYYWSRERSACATCSRTSTRERS